MRSSRISAPVRVCPANSITRIKNANVVRQRYEYYKYTVTIHPRDHAESAISPAPRSVSAERMMKQNVALAWGGWIRRMDGRSLVCHEQESTVYGVNREIVEQEGCLTKGWRMNVPNHAGARDYHSAVLPSFALQPWRWVNCHVKEDTRKRGINSGKSLGCFPGDPLPP